MACLCDGSSISTWPRRVGGVQKFKCCFVIVAVVVAAAVVLLLLLVASLSTQLLCLPRIYNPFLAFYDYKPKQQTMREALAPAEGISPSLSLVCCGLCHMQNLCVV